jgi:hypothetical protein
MHGHLNVKFISRYIPKQIWEVSAASWVYYKNLSRCTVTWTSNPSALFYSLVELRINPWGPVPKLNKDTALCYQYHISPTLKPITRFNAFLSIYQKRFCLCVTKQRKYNLYCFGQSLQANDRALTREICGRFLFISFSKFQSKAPLIVFTMGSTQFPKISPQL